MKKFILLFTFLLLPNVVFADNNFLLSCDKNKINVNDQVICRYHLNLMMNIIILSMI